MARPTFFMFACLLTLSTSYSEPAAAQSANVANSCDTAPAAMRAKPVSLNPALGVARIENYEIGKPYHVPDRVLDSGEEYFVSYEIHARCAGARAAICGSVASLDLSLRHRFGAGNSSSMRQGVEQRPYRMHRQMCGTRRRVTLPFRAPLVETNSAGSNYRNVTVGVCPPDPTFPCAIHRIRVAPPRPDTGWHVSRTFTAVQAIRAGQGFTLAMRLLNSTMHPTWPGAEATLWVYPPLSATPTRVARQALPRIAAGQGHGLQILVQGMTSGSHMFQACVSGTPNASHAESKCGSRTAIRVSP